MSRPHPKGPRAFRSFCEPDRLPTRSRLATGSFRTDDHDRLTVSLTTHVVALSPADHSRFSISESTTMIPIHQNPKPSQPEGIDLTGFAGRFAPPGDMIGAGFDLPASFFSRLKACHPVILPATHPVELGLDYLTSMATKP